MRVWARAPDQETTDSATPTRMARGLNVGGWIMTSGGANKDPKETTMADHATVTRKQLIDKLNEDLSREYQAIIAYVVYSQVLKGAQYMSIAKELEGHAAQELKHALTISKHIDY